MTICTCARAATLAFSDGLVLRRCHACERTTWVLDGREISVSDARSELHGRFSRFRLATTTTAPGRRQGPSATVAVDLAARRRARADAVREQAESAARHSEITAALVGGGVGVLLAARGLPGTWSVLGGTGS